MTGDTLLRQWLMLQHIPLWPARRSTSEIAERLAADGHEVSVRTVQRDLSSLSTLFEISSEEQGRTLYWFFPRATRLVELPGMEAAAALTFALSREHLADLLPPETLDLLRPYFRRAEEVLQQSVRKGLASWRSRVAVVRAGPRLAEPDVRDEVQRGVYEAVLNLHQVRVQYRRRGTQSDEEMLLHPLGLMIKRGVIYLVAMAYDYTDVRQYALHRMHRVEVLEAPARRLEGFTLADYVARQGEYPVSGRPLRLVARFALEAALHLAERPLSDDQALTEGDGYTEVRATVADTAELRWWLLGFGEHVEVLRPAALRRAMRAHARAMAGLYG